MSNFVQLFALLTRVHSPNFRRNRRDPIPHKIAQDAQDAQEIWESTDVVQLQVYTNRALDLTDEDEQNVDAETRREMTHCKLLESTVQLLREFLELRLVLLGIPDDADQLLLLRPAHHRFNHMERTAETRQGYGYAWCVREPVT